MSPNEAIRLAAKSAIDAGNLAHARALLDLLEVTPVIVRKKGLDPGPECRRRRT